MGGCGCVYVFSLMFLLLLDNGQKMTMCNNHDLGEMFDDVMKDPAMSSMVKKMAMSSMSMVKDQDMMFLKAGVDTKGTTSTTAMKAMFTNTKDRAREMGEMERSRNMLLNDLVSLFNVPKRQMADSVNRLLNDLGVQIQGLGTMDDNCDESDNIRCDRQAKFRMADGTCNNLRKPIWGASFISFRRFLEPAYDDDVSSPRMTGKNGEELPSARRVSLIVHEADRKAPKGAGPSHMLMQWGQFLDHDISSTPISSGANGASARCCMEDIDANGQLIMNPEDRDICFPIKIPDNDPQFTQKRCLNFVRSIQIQNTECQQAPVEQMNQITAFIDGSMVYGSSDDDTKELRALTRGLLKTSRNDLLPENDRRTCLKTKRTDFCFKAGDARVNEQMALATLHTVWMREHNRMARELGDLNPRWNDEKIFQETRKILGAKLQHITYNEFLPIVLSVGFRNQFNLNPHRSAFEDMYDENVDPSIRNAFASAAYRFGHSMVRSMFSQMGRNYRRMENLRLKSSFGNTSHLIDENGDGVNRYVRGLVTDKANNIDRFMTPQVTQHLFEDRAGNSLDLAAINIQRGRDHGLPGYNEWRKWCNLPVARRFNRNRGGLIHHPPQAVNRLRRIYRHPDDIDLFAGGISERRMRGALVGPTFSCILSHQFKALKVGDRFWYERGNPETGFTANQLNAIKQTTLARVLCDNTDIGTMQPNAFKVVNRRNRRQSCDQLTQSSLTAWSDDPEIRNSANEHSDDSVFDNSNDGFDNGIRENNNNGFSDSNNDGFVNETGDSGGGNDGIDNGNNDFDDNVDGNNDFGSVTNDNNNGNGDNVDRNSDNGNGVSGNGNNGNGNLNNGNSNVDNGDGFSNTDNGFDNGNDFGIENGDTGNENDDFDSGNNDFDNGNNFGNTNSDFGNGNGDTGNGNDGLGNGDNEFDDNDNNDFGNGNDFGDGNGDFGNGGDFDNDNGDFDNDNGDFDNDNGDFDNDNGDFDNDNGDFNNGNGDFDNDNGDFNKGNGDFDNDNGDFNNDNGDFDKGNSDFDNGNGDFDNGNSDFDNGNSDFDNDNSNFDGQNNSNDRSDEGNNGNSDLNNNSQGNNGFNIWGEWSICIRGRNTRTRLCSLGTRCFGIRSQTKSCALNSWSAWSRWSACTDGQQTRRRRCTGQNLSCQGNSFDRKPCGSLRDASWSPWSRWGECTNGKRFRRRQCDSNQQTCVGPSSQSQICSNQNGCSKSIFKIFNRFLC